MYALERELEKELYELSLDVKRKEKVQQLKEEHKEKLKNGPSVQSGKKKKQQLRNRKARLAKHHEEKSKIDDNNINIKDTVAKLTKRHEEMKLEVALGRTRKETTDRELATFFVKETKEQVYLRIAQGREPLNNNRKGKPILSQEIVRDTVLDHPIRPKWAYGATKIKVEHNETILFDAWLDAIHTKYGHSELNHFEHNLEVWRQLWRVLERSTHIVLVVDIRNPLLHIPPSLYDYVTEELKKPLVIVLNKTDLVPEEATQVWLTYLQQHFPLCTYITFSSRHEAVKGNTNVAIRRKALMERLVVGDPSAVASAAKILCACGVENENAKVVISEMNDYDPSQLIERKPRKSRRRKEKKEKRIQRQNENSCEFCGDGMPIVSCVECSGGFEPLRMCYDCDVEIHQSTEGHTVTKIENTTEKEDTERVAKVVIGLVGHPNVGKSSVLNALAGKKLVSVSHTPGHTKKLQTIWIADTICLCDCPGLVFPYTGIPRYMQELSGLYPFAQITEPLSALRFLAEHLDLETLLGLTPRTQEFDGLDEVIDWTPWSIAEAYAEKKKYKTDRRGRPDFHRAGVELIRDCVDGVIPLFHYPPDYN